MSLSKDIIEKSFAGKVFLTEAVRQEPKVKPENPPSLAKFSFFKEQELTNSGSNPFCVKQVL
jgi:hypothetical protein